MEYNRNSCACYNFVTAIFVASIPDLLKQFISYMLGERGAGIATGYGLDDRVVGVRVPVWARIFSSPRRPDRLWGPPSLLSNGYRVLLPRG
jgi:hypothetical protein